MRVAIIETMENTRLGNLITALDQAGADQVWFRVWNGEALPVDHAGFDALIVPGGWPSALDDAESPYLPKIIDLMRGFEAADKSVLGICLGAQLMARAYAADNLLGVAREFGWTQHDVTSAGRQDPLLAGVGDTFTSFQWHRDTFTLPQHAVLLATNGVVPNQCFRVGRATYGVQFHFEASLPVVEAWTSDYPNRVEALAPGWMQTRAEESLLHADAADQVGLKIARNFVATIAEHNP